MEDHSAGTLRLGEDILINFKFAWALNSPPFDGIRLNGTKGGLVFNKYAENPFILYSSKGETMTDTILNLNVHHKFEHIQNPGIYLIVEHFLDVLDGKAEPIVTKEEALNVVTIIQAFYRPAELKREVTAEEIEGM